MSTHSALCDICFKVLRGFIIPSRRHFLEEVFCCLSVEKPNVSQNSNQHLHVPFCIKRAELNPAPGSCAPSPLTCAVKRGHHQAIRFLLERGADMCMRDFSQRTCMHVAVYSADLETVNILLEVSILVAEAGLSRLADSVIE